MVQNIYLAYLNKSGEENMTIKCIREITLSHYDVIGENCCNVVIVYSNCLKILLNACFLNWCLFGAYFRDVIFYQCLINTPHMYTL